MASGTSSPTAEEVLRTTKEKANFQRLTRLLMRGGLVLLREVFDSIHPPGSLSAVLRANEEHLKNLTTPAGYKVFSRAERKSLYDPHGPGTYGKSAEFDISLLYKLLRSICSLPAPVTGWGKLPNSTDHSREADIERIRHYRNEIYSHDRLMQVTDADFEKLWMDIREALLRIAEGISSAKREDWKKAIEKFFHAPLTPDAEECVDELQLWYLEDLEIKHTLDQMQLKHAEMQKQLEQLQSTLDIFITALIQQEPITSSNSVLEVEGAQSPSESVETRISIPQEQPSAEGAAGQSTSTELPASQQNNTEVQNFWDDVYSSNRSLNRLKKYLKKKFGANVLGDRRGSLIITVSCSSLEVLEELWKEYRTGHLNEVIQATLVTAEVLEKLNLKEVKLRTIISEEDYLSYKEFLNKSAAKGKMTIPQVQGSPAMELVEGKTEMKSSQEPAVIASKLPAGETETKTSQEPAVFASKLPAGEEKMTIPQVQGAPTMEFVEGKTVSTTSRTEPTTAEFLAGPTHGKPSQVVKGDYIARSGYVLILNDFPITRGPFKFERTLKKRLFAEKFGFTTREDIGLTTSDMLKALTDTAQRDFSSNDCFCCIIGSTGTEHGICGTDDKPIDIKTITSLFTSDKCPSLDGKPKIFVLQPKYQSFSVLEYEPGIEARSMLQHLVISEKDFLVWNLFAEAPRFYKRFLFVDDWVKYLLEGIHLKKAIATVTGGNEQPLSLLSTLEKNVFFEPNTAV